MTLPTLLKVSLYALHKLKIMYLKFCWFRPVSLLLLRYSKSVSLVTERFSLVSHSDKWDKGQNKLKEGPDNHAWANPGPVWTQCLVCIIHTCYTCMCMYSTWWRPIRREMSDIIIKRTSNLSFDFSSLWNNFSAKSCGSLRR